MRRETHVYLTTGIHNIDPLIYYHVEKVESGPMYIVLEGANKLGIAIFPKDKVERVEFVESDLKRMNQ